MCQEHLECMVKTGSIPVLMGLMGEADEKNKQITYRKLQIKSSKKNKEGCHGMKRREAPKQEMDVTSGRMISHGLPPTGAQDQLIRSQRCKSEGKGSPHRGYSSCNGLPR